MAKHIVICKVCGRQFDESIESAHYDRNSRRYTCMDCVNEQRQNTTGGKKQGHGAMIAKIVIGAIFLVSGFTTGSVGPTLPVVKPDTKKMAPITIFAIMAPWPCFFPPVVFCRCLFTQSMQVYRRELRS